MIYMRRISLHTVGSGVPYPGIYQMHGHKCCKCSTFMHKCVHCKIVSKSEKNGNNVVGECYAVITHNKAHLYTFESH